MKKLSMYLAAATLCLTPCLALADALPFETLPDDVSGIELDMTHPIDNMIKGAAGQAIQNMNHLYHFEETTGLNLIAQYA